MAKPNNKVVALFGPKELGRYTDRHEALADGELIDVSKTAQKVAFNAKARIAITRDVYENFVKGTTERAEETRLKQIIRAAAIAAIDLYQRSTVFYITDATSQREKLVPLVIAVSFDHKSGRDVMTICRKSTASRRGAVA